MAKNKGGTSEKEIDMVIRLAKIGLTEYQIAYVLNRNIEYIENNYTSAINNNLPQNYIELRLRRLCRAYPEFGGKIRYKIRYKKYRKFSIRRLNDSIRSQFYIYLKRVGIKKNWHTFNLLGYTVGQLKQHLEKQFKDGMSWDNYGKIWHIDHIKPVSWFNYKSVIDEQFKECWSLNNLQPMFASENLSKGNRWIG